jgi:hypothetical protein
MNSEFFADFNISLTSIFMYVWKANKHAVTELIIQIHLTPVCIHSPGRVLDIWYGRDEVCVRMATAYDTERDPTCKG